MSISYIGVKFLLEKLGTFENKRFLIVGTGKMGRLALNYVMDSRPGAVYMTNRNHQKVIDLRSDYPDIQMIPYEDRYRIIPEVDVVISATASAHSVIRMKDMPALHSPVAFMDLAVPQDIEPEIGTLPGVSLFNIDSLMRISEENENRRRLLAAEAQVLLEQDLQEFIEWMHSVKADPAIMSLNTLRKQVEEDTFDYLTRKLEMDPRDRRLMEKMISSALKRMIREPIMMLKSLKDEEEIARYSQAVEELFQFRRS
jgi:glutamyl-tRNA reductase